MSETVREKMSAKDKTTLLILILMSVFLYADQNAIYPVVNDIIQEYGIDEAGVGTIGSAFTIIGALVSLVFGVLADRTNRKRLLILVVLVGEIPCFLTGIKMFTQTYEQLLFLRILTGLGVGGIFPITFSLVGDYFRAEHRAFVNALIGAAWAIGQVFGQTMAGFLAGSLGWRFPFILAAVPNFILVPLFLLWAKEPKRGAKEEGIAELVAQGYEYQEKFKLRDLKHIITNRTNLLGFIQGIPGSIPWGILPFFLIPYYETVKGFSKGAATTLSLIFGVGATLGGIVGGWIGERIYKKNPKMLPIFCGLSILLGIVPTLILLTMNFPVNPTLVDLIRPAIFGLFSGMLITLPAANIKTILLNVNPPERRGSVFSIFNITDSIGRGLGPFIGGQLIVTSGYIFTVVFAALMWIPCGLIFLAIFWTIKKDLQKMTLHLREKKMQMEQMSLR